MVSPSHTRQKRATILVALLLVLGGCTERGAFPPGEYDTADRLKVDWGETYEERQLTEREYNAIKVFFKHARWVKHERLVKDIEGARITINGTEWQVYRSSLCQDRKRRLEVDGLEFSDGRGGFLGFDSMIAWAESR